MQFAAYKSIILGASSGLAEATLAALAAAGMHLVLHGRRREVLEVRARHLTSRHAIQTRCITGPITDPDLGERLWQALNELPGTPLGLVCFVGAPGRIAPEDWTVDTFARLFGVNTAGPLLITRDWARRMQAAGYTGNAVLFSTMQACYPFEGSLLYAVSKAALSHGVRILAKEFGSPPPIRINAIAPGVNEAGMAQASIARGKYAPYLERGVIPRYGRGEDIARAVMFLLQPDLYMTGETLLMDGGLTLRRDLR